MADRDAYNIDIDDGDGLHNGYFNGITERLPPIGGIISWLKNYSTADSGTTDGTTTSKLVDAGQNFQTTVAVGNIVRNTTDDTWTHVTAVDSDSILSLNDDIMITGEDYVIYDTPYLRDTWVECNGQALSDADSPYNGQTIPDLNGYTGTQRFLRGGGNSDGSTAVISAAIGGSETHTHTIPNASFIDGENQTALSETTNATSTLPSYYEVVFIIRVK